MASDQRWTGGLANREWQRGSRVEQPVDSDYIALQVRRYLKDCARFELAPSEAMCLKVIFHAGDAQKQAVVGAYRQLTMAAAPDGQASRG